MQKKRGRLWWYLRMSKAYRRHGVKQSRCKTWEEAMFSRRFMDADAQRVLKPLKK